MVNENAAMQRWEGDIQGQTVETKEALDDPIADSKFFNYYTPKE